MFFQKLFNPKHLSAYAMVGIVAGMILACGGTNNGGTSCTFDSECSVGMVCDTSNGGGSCVATCNTDTDCGTGFKCLARQNASDGSKVCTSTGTSNNTGGACTTNEQCEQRLGAGAFCDSTNQTCVNPNGTSCTSNEECEQKLGPNAFCGPGGKCESPMTTYGVLLIEDNTTEDCDNISDPGSDIIWVQLTDAQGNAKGYANAISADTQNLDNNEYSNFGILDGSPANAGLCVEGGFSADKVYSMGCGGTLLIEFTSGGNPVSIVPGDRIRVAEHGGMCSTGTNVDSFSVYLCTDTNDAKNNLSTSSCTRPVVENQFGDSSGTIPQ